LFAACLAVAAALPILARAQSSPEEYRFATGLYKQQRWDLAADAFRKFLSKYPKHERVPYARLYLGMTLVNADKFADARQVLRDYVHDYPQSKSLPDALYRVGECSYLLDDLKSAESEFDQFLKQYPQHELVEWALPYLADTELRLKKPEAARDLFKKALEQYPKSRLADDAKFGLARAYEDLKQSSDAAALYAELGGNVAGPRAPQALMNLATIQFRSEKYNDASKSFLRLADEFPKSSLAGSARLNAGFSLYQMGQFSRAIEQFEKAAGDKRQALRAGYWKGISLKALGDYPKAIEVLKATFESNPKSDVAENTLFYWADCELRIAHYDAARRLFLDLVQQWPKGDFADDSLHFAAEAALVAGSPDEAERLVARFDKEYPASPLRLHEEILLARVLNAKATAILKHTEGAAGEKNRQEADKDRRTAIEHLENVIRKSQLPRTVALAQYHLGRTLQDSGEYARAVEVLAPLVEQAARPQASPEAVESLVVSGHSSHLLGKHEAAVATLSKYLALRPKGTQSEQALADRALSNAALGHREAAGADVVQLFKQFPQGAVGPETIRRLAEMAYDAKDWSAAGELFGKMAELGTASPEVRRMGLSGVGWVKYQTKAYADSAAAFGQVFEHDSASNSQVAEAGYMQALALQKAGRSDDAAKAYAAAFQKLAPSSPAEPGEETRGPGKYAFLAGVQAASVLAQLKHYDESDAAYEHVAERFPKAERLGQMLFDWANMLYVAKNDPAHRERIRGILARIVRDFPESPANDNARLFAAQLDLADGKTDAAAKTFHELLANPKADAKVREAGMARLIALAVDKEDWGTVRQLAEKFLVDFKSSADVPVVRLDLASAQLGLKDAPAAEKTLGLLKQEITFAKAPPADWAARVWVLLAEAYYQQKKYAEVETTVNDLHERMPKSPLGYQADEILGRSFKNQTQWDKALAAFQRVVNDLDGQQNSTAAKSQLMIAEIRFLQKDYRQARLDYLKVTTSFSTLPEWTAPALFQVGQCEELLQQPGDAEKTYKQLIAGFPSNDYAKEAQKRLNELRKRTSG